MLGSHHGILDGCVFKGTIYSHSILSVWIYNVYGLVIGID